MSTVCQQEFSINTPYACPVGGFNSNVILFWIALVFMLYLLIGTAYNYKYREITGKEALPHIDFWREFPEYVNEGIVTTIRVVGEIAKKFRKDGSAGYNNI